MSKTGITLLFCGILASLSSPSVGQVRPADAYAAQSLDYSMLKLLHASKPPLGRAVRLVNLAEFSSRLGQSDLDIQRILARIQGDEKAYLKVLEALLKKQPQDSESWKAWLQLKLKQLNHSSKRVEFLSPIVADKDRPVDLRVMAAYELAVTLRGRGQEQEAMQICRQALELSPVNPSLVEFALAAQKASIAGRARLMMTVLAKNPRRVDVAAELGELLSAAGMHELALRFYDYARQANARMGLAEEVSHSFMIQHINTMLDAGQYKRAIYVYGPALKTFFNSTMLRTLLIEAAEATGNEEIKAKCQQEIRGFFEPYQVAKTITGSMLAELAWFHLVTLNEPKEARRYAIRAERREPDLPHVKRVVAASGLLTSDPGKASTYVKSMESLAKDDPFSAAILAEYFFRRGEAEKGRQMVLAGLELSRSGQAARWLLKLARQYNVTLPASPASDELKRTIESFDLQIFALGLDPDKYIQVTIKPVKDSAFAGQPLLIDVTLTNVSKMSVPVGPEAMIPTTVRCSVVVPQAAKKEFPAVRLARIAAPRVLAPGQSVQRRLRMDVGDLGKWLNTNPLETRALTVRVTTVASDIAGMKDRSAAELASKPAVISRRSLLELSSGSAGQSKADSYRYLMRVLVAKMGSKAVESRMEAARQIGSLLMLADALRNSEIKLSDELSAAISRPLLIRMTQEILKDPSDVVRAEMIASLQEVRLDDLLLEQLASVVGDDSSLVRFRLVELLGSCGQPGQTPILVYFSKDKYDLVAKMAEGLLKFQPGRKRPGRPEAESTRRW